MNIKICKITEIKPNPENPRIIKDEKFKKLINSIEEFPEMLNLKPIIVDEDMMILGGNMRYRACRELKKKEVPVVIYSKEFHEESSAHTEHGKTYEEAKKEIIIKDNVSFGDWDWDILANEWNSQTLNKWAVDVWQPDNIDYDPNLNPETQYSDITADEIQREAKKLAEQMIKESKNIDVICPACGHEFEVHIS